MSIINAVSSNIKNVVLPYWTNKKPEEVTAGDAAVAFTVAATWPISLPFVMTACAADEKDDGKVADELQDDGIDMTPVGDDDDLPADEDGDPILPDDIWTEIEGEGRFFLESPELEFASGKIQGKNLQNLNLYVEVGTDPTRLDGIMPADGCFDGLINVNQLTQEDIDHGIVGCPEAGYESFAVCPSDEGNRLPVYLAAYTIAGRETVLIEDINDLYLNPEAAERIGNICDGLPSNIIEIPRGEYSDGMLDFHLKLRLIIDARQAVDSAVYKTPLGVTIKAE